MRLARIAGVAAILALTPAAAAHAAIPQGELLQDPGAEDSAGAPDSSAQPPVPGWAASGTFTATQYGAPDFPDAAEGARIGGGKNFFSGGPNADVSTGEQIVDVSGAAAEIDRGGVPVILSGFLGGYSSQDDNVVVQAAFLGGDGSQLGAIRIGPVLSADRSSLTKLLPRSAGGTLPAGTRAIRVQIVATRTAGTYNDGYADNLSLRLEAAVAAPVFAQTVTVTAVSGSVLVEEPGSKRFVPVKRAKTFRVGSIIDARHGRVRLTASDGHGGTQSSDFFEGEFKLLQPSKLKGLVELDLFGGSFKSCPRGLRSAAAAKSKSVRHLWGQGSGKFRTVGRFASATLRGTTWLTSDRCDGTQIRVTAGRVTVFDRVKKRSVLVAAPGTYFAAARRG